MWTSTGSWPNRVRFLCSWADADTDTDVDADPHRGRINQAKRTTRMTSCPI